MGVTASFTPRAESATDRGLVRAGNEDAVYAGRRLFAVADGVGGQPAGEVASDIVIRALAPLDDGAELDDPLAALRDALALASQRIREAGEVDSGRDGMATTVTALLLAGEKLALLHVGDSRAYRLRDGVLRQLTADHTYVQWLVAQGMLSPAEARDHPQRSIVTQVVQGEEAAPAVELLTPQHGDRYLLCSDGLSDVVTDESIAEVLAGAGEPQQHVERLIKLALQAGAPDNVSVVVLADIRAGVRAGVRAGTDAERPAAG